MGIIRIRPVQREGARIVLGLAGVSGSGKTYSAIQVAYGLANYRPGKVGLLDTENKRGSIYENALVYSSRPTEERFLIGDLIAPFSPSRYADAIREFQVAGVDVLVIDSVSHEWAGVGGCDDIANEGNPKIPRWNEAKRQHKRFMSALLQCDMHIIACIRAQEKVRLEKVNGKTEFIPIGLQPIQEKSFCFELTASILMHDQGKRYDVLKCPNEISRLLPGDAYLTAETGYMIRAWLDGAKQLDPKVEKFRNRLITVCEEGEAKIKDAWQKTPEPIRKALGPSFFDEILASAQEYDRQRTQFDASDAVENLNRDVRGVPLDFDAANHGDPS